MAGRGTAVILVVSLLGLIALVVYSSGRFGPEITRRSRSALLFPSWSCSSSGVLLRTVSALERPDGRSASGWSGSPTGPPGNSLAGVSHELVPHLERCNVKAEALVVAVEYQDVGADIKVAVPEMVIETDPSIFRQILASPGWECHSSRRQESCDLGRRGGWFDEDQRLRRRARAPEGAGAQVFARFVDLAEQARSPLRSGSGFAVIRGLSEHIGAELGYKRDPSWTHFSVSLPMASAPAGSLADRVPLEAGAR